MKGTPHELKYWLANSIRENPTSYIIEEIFTRFPTPEELIDVTEQELISINGIGKTKARQILAALKFAQTLSISPPPVYKIQCPEDVFKLAEPEMRYLKVEHFVILMLDSKNRVIAKELISIGCLNACIVHPREVFRPAIKRNCASIICIHNHPSGNPDPSPEDGAITKRLTDAGTIIGIEVLDHIVIGHHKYVSLKERGCPISHVDDDGTPPFFVFGLNSSLRMKCSSDRHCSGIPSNQRGMVGIPSQKRTLTLL
ncbi:DNA repair protein RadC, partial [Paenibacillus glycanilyticus]|uniref:RadC family protein n=1 Tax=Paenibacillus glycanilyticus TaxID=126569 RepID=UPI00203D3CE3